MATDTSASLAGKTIFMSGGSRGIGLAIARRAARDGANVALLAKSAEPNPKLEGTIYTAAEEIECAGGRALPIVGDVRDADVVGAAVEQAAGEFGGIDIVVNNASAIALLGTEELEVKRYDLVQSINARGTFVVTQACIPCLKRAANPHVLTLSPPLNLNPKWFASHAAYTISKYNMSMLALGWAEEFREEGIASNALWPRTLIATAAVMNLLGGEEAVARCPLPETPPMPAGRAPRPRTNSETGRCLMSGEPGERYGRFGRSRGYHRSGDRTVRRVRQR